MNRTIVLRSITEEDTFNIVKWRNTKSVKQNLYNQNDLTPEQHLNWLKNEVRTGRCAQYIISVKDDSEKNDIGTVFIKNIDRDYREGEFGIQIGEESNRGKGYGGLATVEILKIAFEQLELNKVYLTVMCDNFVAIRVYEKAGFVQEEILKDKYLRENIYVDVIKMSITKDQWLRRYNKS